MLEALHPDPDYDDPEPETRDAFSHYAPAHLESGRTVAVRHAPANLTVTASGGNNNDNDGLDAENGENFETVSRNKNNRSEVKALRSAEAEDGRSHRYQKRKSNQQQQQRQAVAERLPGRGRSSYLHGLGGHRRPVDLYDTFRLNTLKKHRRGSLHPQY